MLSRRFNATVNAKLVDERLLGASTGFGGGVGGGIGRDFGSGTGSGLLTDGLGLVNFLVGVVLIPKEERERSNGARESATYNSERG
jgi:hypothetical protein